MTYYRPPNQNPGHPARHTLIWGCTGSGKSQILKSGHVVPLEKDVRVIGYDDVGSLPGLYFTSRKGFVSALKAAIKRGGGFRVFYAGTQTTEDHEWWCDVVRSCLDGNLVTYVVTEELASVCPHAGEAPPNAAWLLNQGRKYGVRFVGLTQRPQEISKTYYSQCTIKIVGAQSEENEKKAARAAGVSEEAIKALAAKNEEYWNPRTERYERVHFYRNEGRASGGELLAIVPSAAKGVNWKD